MQTIRNRLENIKYGKMELSTPYWQGTILFTPAATAAFTRLLSLVIIAGPFILRADTMTSIPCAALVSPSRSAVSPITISPPFA